MSYIIRGFINLLFYKGFYRNLQQIVYACTTRRTVLGPVILCFHRLLYIKCTIIYYTRTIIIHILLCPYCVMLYIMYKFCTVFNYRRDTHDGDDGVYYIFYLRSVWATPRLVSYFLITPTPSR